MMRLATVGALALFATAAQAQIPDPRFGEGGLLFAAWDQDISYSVYLDIDFEEFDTGVTQSFDLGDGFSSFFADAYSWNVIAATGPGDVFFGGGEVLTTGSITNLTAGAGVVALISAAGGYVSDVNAACGFEEICTATSADVHFAGRDTYGSALGFSGGVSTAVSSGDAGAFSLVEQLVFDPDSQAPVTPLIGTWQIDGNSLNYVVPVPAAFWLLLSGVAGLVGARRRS